MFKKMTAKECFDKRHSITYEDKLEYCKRKAFYQLGYAINLEDPKTLNEKIIWLALNYQNDAISLLSDKITAKEIVSSKVGSQYVVPLIKTYDTAEEFAKDFATLPESFVIKSSCGWAAKSVKIVNDKSKVNLKLLLEEITKWLMPWNNYYYNNCCIGLENIRPRLLVEKLLIDDAPSNAKALTQGSLPASSQSALYGHAVRDYKLFVMNGKAQFFYIVDERLHEKETKTFLTLDWKILPCHRWNVPAAKVIAKPPCIDEMIKIGETLAKDFPLVRVDFYYVNGQVYVGELTFTPGMFLSIEPREWDYELGKLLNINKA